ncbi:MAG: flavin reductase family protein [Solirubrobacteraceae bacterium]
MSGVEKTFDALADALDYTMLIVTTAAGDERAGCLVGFATQCSIEPRRFLVCLSRLNRTFEIAERRDALAVHFPAADVAHLAELFGGQTGDEVDKFADCAWHEGPEGMPILDDCGQWLVGRVSERVGLGDHVGFVLDPLAVCFEAGEGQFSFRRAKRIVPGHPA